MTSFFGRANVNNSEDFLRDLRLIHTFTVDDIKWVTNELHNWLLDDASNDSNEVIESISGKLKLKYRESQRLLSIIKYLFVTLAPDGDASDDSVDDLVDDLISSEALDKEQFDFYKEVFDLIRDSVGVEYLTERKKEQFKSEGLPRIVGITSTVNLRAVIDNKYESDMDISTYSPKISGFVPMATLRLRATEDSPTVNFYCQIERKALKKLIDHLSALEKDFDAIDLVEV